MSRPSNQGSGVTLLLLSVLAASCLVATARPGSNVIPGAPGAIHFPKGPENATHMHSLAVNSTSPLPFTHTAKGEHTHHNGSQLALRTAASSSPQPLPEKLGLNHTHNHTNFEHNFTAEGLNRPIPAAPFEHGARGHAGGQHGRSLLQHHSTGQHAHKSGPLGVNSSPRPVGSSSSPNPHSGQQHPRALSSPHPQTAGAAKHGRSLMQKAKGQLGTEPRNDSPRPLVGSSPHPAHSVPQAGSSSPHIGQQHSQSLSSPHPHISQQHSQALSSPHPQGAAAAKHGRSLMQKAEGQHVMQQLGTEPRKDSPHPLVGSSPHPAHNMPQAGTSSPHPAHSMPQAGSSSPHPAHSMPQAGSSSPQPGFQAGQRGHAGAPNSHTKQ